MTIRIPLPTDRDLNVFTNLRAHAAQWLGRHIRHLPEQVPRRTRHGPRSGARRAGRHA